ncbi:hypothetical protein [Streptomyces sp. 8N706]|uniref:hypothetical protein n=1 Tax=Streptomyces sp. 8N706 TaxID=3457416 RepID=UPI003FD49647
MIGPDGKPVKTWSSLAKAGRQHIASGASRLRPSRGGRGPVRREVRARKGAFITEERAYADNRGGPGSGEKGFDGREFKAMVDAAGGNVAAAVQKWLVDTGRIEPGTEIVGLEIRAWSETR